MQRGRGVLHRVTAQYETDSRCGSGMSSVVGRSVAGPESPAIPRQSDIENRQVLMRLAPLVALFFLSAASTFVQRCGQLRRSLFARLPAARNNLPVVVAE